jgi:hypothetical protein
MSKDGKQPARVLTDTGVGILDVRSAREGFAEELRKPQ